MHGYEELLVTGTHDEVRAFLAGWATGQGLALRERDERVLLSKDQHIRSETRLESVVEALRPGHVTHVVVRDDVAEPLVQALGAGGRPAGVEVRARRRVRAASFEFEYQLFTHEEGAEVQAIFAALPEGVVLSGEYRPRETVDPTATGVELYAPVHGYALAAHGTARGPLPGILELHRRAARHERVRAKEIVLELEA